jgi:hypothetical protein
MNQVKNNNTSKNILKVQNFKQIKNIMFNYLRLHNLVKLYGKILTNQALQDMG